MELAVGGELDAPALPVPTLRSNFAWTLLGNVLYAGCQWGMLSVLAKLGSAAVVGQFTLGLAISAPVFMFTNLQLRSVQATDANGQFEFCDYFVLRLLANFVGLLAVMAILPFVGATPTLRLIILLVAVSKAIEAMSDVTAGLLQREERLDRVAISLMVRGIASFGVFAALYVVSKSLVAAVAGLAGVWLAVFLLYDVHNVKILLESGSRVFRFDWNRLRELLLLSLPLGWVATLVSLNANIPRYFLQHYLGLADQGLYASLAYLVVAINLIVVALAQSATTRLSRMFAVGDYAQFRTLLGKLSVSGLLIILIGVPLTLVCGRPVLTLLYRAEYGAHVGLLALFVGTAGLSTIGSFLFCGASAARSFRAQVPIYLASTAASLIATSLLTPRYGLIGAGLSLLVSVLVILVGGLWLISNVLSMEPKRA